MAKISVVNGVRFSDDGTRPTHVRWGIVDTDRNEWITGPAEAEVIEVIDALMGGNEVWTIYTVGSQTVPGPRLRTVGDSEETEGVETHPGPDDHRTLRDLPRF
ncbi:phosphatidylserine/phosphatidylglycerophosphate/cardiolipin synthase [Piscinibacter sp.]|jgi:hypothetical protein|uniref:phosphatidylserine/phosphatidylglycerophosphate/ cardiolipin synthase n=1 Tax=Piscinibacter sp. TaxID=1903157 RepID=UPI0035594D7B